MSDITLTNRELLMAAQGLRTIGAKPIKNVRVAFSLAILKRVGNTALTDLEAARIALCEQYAAKNGNGGEPVKLPDGTYDIPDRAAFDKAFNELLDQKTTLANCKPIQLGDLDGTEGFSADDLFTLGPLVVTSEIAKV